MGVTLDYKKEIVNLTKELPEDRLLSFDLVSYKNCQRKRFDLFLL